MVKARGSTSSCATASCAFRASRHPAGALGIPRGPARRALHRRLRARLPRSQEAQGDPQPGGGAARSAEMTEMLVKLSMEGTTTRRSTRARRRPGRGRAARLAARMTGYFSVSTARAAGAPPGGAPLLLRGATVAHSLRRVTAGPGLQPEALEQQVAAGGGTIHLTQQRARPKQPKPKAARGGAEQGAGGPAALRRRRFRRRTTTRKRRTPAGEGAARHPLWRARPQRASSGGGGGATATPPACCRRRCQRRLPSHSVAAPPPVRTFLGARRSRASAAPSRRSRASTARSKGDRKSTASSLRTARSDAHLHPSLPLAAGPRLAAAGEKPVGARERVGGADRSSHRQDRLADSFRMHLAQDEPHRIGAAVAEPHGATPPCSRARFGSRKWWACTRVAARGGRDRGGELRHLVLFDDGRLVAYKDEARSVECSTSTSGTSRSAPAGVEVGGGQGEQPPGAQPLRLLRRRRQPRPSAQVAPLAWGAATAGAEGPNVSNLHKDDTVVTASHVLD